MGLIKSTSMHLSYTSDCSGLLCSASSECRSEGEPILTKCMLIFVFAIDIRVVRSCLSHLLSSRDQTIASSLAMRIRKVTAAFAFPQCTPLISALL